MSLHFSPSSLLKVWVVCSILCTTFFQSFAFEAPVVIATDDPTIGTCSLFDVESKVAFDRAVNLEPSSLTPKGKALSLDAAPPASSTSPTDNAADPTLDAADVAGLYGGSYSSIATNLSPDWGQTTAVNTDFDPGTGNLVMHYSSLNYQGTLLTATNLSAMTHVHIDVWVAEGTERQLKFTPVNNGTGTGESLVEVPLTPGSWNSVDLPKSAFTGMSWDSVFQLKFDGQFNADGSANGAGWDVYLDNLYFYNDGSGTTTEITYVDVTFNVNMSNEVVSTDGVYLAGGDDFGAPGANPMTDAGNGIWTITKQVPAPYTGNYTFVNGNCGDWSCKEDISGQDCAFGQYYDRNLNNITENHVVNTCFGECTTDGTCPAPPTVTYPVTFSVNTDNITVGPNGMYIGGGFLGGADAHALTDNGGNNWSITLDLFEGTTGNWVFLNSPTHPGDWNTKEDLAGETCADAANYNDRYLAPLSAATTLEYCFAECTADCPAPPTTVDVTFQVDMSLYEGTFGGVFVNGTYNNWCGSCNPMTDNGDGTWALTIPLEPGTIQYKFTLDGWAAQEEFNGAESCTAMDGAFSNRTATFDADADLGLVCFNSCSECTTDILGCMDSTADNYDAAATADDGSCGNVEGAWNLTYMCVGSGPGTCEWFSYSAPGDRGCMEDDLFVFNGDGSFQNIMGNQTWTEAWQGVSEGCNAPVAPHDGSNAATYSMANGEITLNGLGAFLGLSKVVNGAEITNPADAATSITYSLNSVDNNSLSVEIHVGSGWWKFNFTRATQGCTDNTALNYVSYFTTDDGSCSFTPGCTDGNAVNYDSEAITDDGSCLYAVTFQVDISNYGLASGATVYTNGTYNGWCGDCNAMTDAGNGLWTGTFNLPAGDQEYKFTINGWDDQEYFNGNEACTTAPAEFVNRLTSISGPTVLPVVCWNTCDACANITNTTAGTGHTGIQEAIDAASAGDVIVLQDGSYAIDAPIAVNKAVTLQGQTEAGVVLDCGAALGGANSIQVTAGATLKDFTLNGNSNATFGIHVQPGTANAVLQGLTITNCASNGIGLSGVTDASVSDIEGSGNVQYVLGIAGSVGVTASDVSGGNVGVYKGTGTYAQTAADIQFLGTFDLAGGFVIEQLTGADEITYSINGDPADVKLPSTFDRAFFANYADLPLPPPYNVASLATIVELDDLATVMSTALATEQLGFFTLNDVAVYNLTAAQWEVSTGLSIQDAIDRAVEGDVISVQDGSYAIATTIDVNKGVTLQGASEAGVVLTCDAALSGSYGLKVTANSATLKDFTLDGAGVAVFGIHVQPGTSNSLLQGLTAMNCVQNGISLTGTNDDAGRNILTDLTVHNNGLLGLGLGASQNVTVSDVTSYSNAFGDIGMYIGDYEGQRNDDLIFEEPLSLSGGFGGISYTIEANDPAGFEVTPSTVDTDDALYNADADVFVPAAYNHSVQVHIPASPFNADLTSYILTQDAAAGLIAGTLNAAPNDNVAVQNLETGAWEVSAGLSIGVAVGLAADGDAIEVATGTYAEALSIDKGLSIDGNGSTLNVAGLGVGMAIASDVDGVSISNFSIAGDADTHSGITVNSGASNVSILDNEIQGLTGTAISLEANTEGVTISDNHFHNIQALAGDGAPSSSGVVAGSANNLTISGNNMEGLDFASVLTACTGVTLDLNQYTGGTSLMLLASLPNSILPDAAQWWSLEASGNIYYFNSAAAQAATNADLQGASIPTVLSSSNPGCMDAAACNYDVDALSEDGSCTYPPATYFDCNGVCENDADGDGICDELEGLVPELETACGQGTVWDAALGQCIMDVQCIGDVDLDGHIGSTDLLYLLGNFGNYCTGTAE